MVLLLLLLLWEIILHLFKLYGFTFTDKKPTVGQITLLLEHFLCSPLMSSYGNSNQLRLQSLTFIFVKAAFFFSQCVQGPTEIHKPQKAELPLSFSFSTSQAAEHKREPANSHLHSNSLHGAQCSRANGQLRGESCDDYLEDLANGDTYFTLMPLHNLSLPLCLCVHSYVLLVFGALLIKPCTSF